MSVDPNDSDYDPDEHLKAVQNQAKAAERLLETERKQREADTAELAKFKAEKRLAEMKPVFEKAGVMPSLARYFPDASELSEEAVAKWAEAEGHTVAAPSPNGASSGQGREFVQQTVGIPTGGTTKISEAEFNRINSENPQMGVQLANSGKVEWSDETLRMSQTPT